MQLNSQQIKRFMAEYVLEENPEDFANSFESQEQLYQYLLDLHKEIDIEDLSDVLNLFIRLEMHEHYLTVKRFIINEIDL